MINTGARSLQIGHSKRPLIQIGPWPDLSDQADRSLEAHEADQNRRMSALSPNSALAQN